MIICVKQAPLDITRDYIFTSEGPIRDRYGEFDLQIEVSRVLR